MGVFGRFSPRLQEAIGQRLGWTSLRPVQDLAGDAILDGRNAVVLAPTAGGKTEASMFPTLSLLLDDPHDGVSALYIAPIKALLNNQAERLGLYTEMVGLQRFVWHGDTGDSERRQFLRSPADLLMTTPESLEVMLVSKRVDTAKLFWHLRIIVIDEVHALAGSDRGAHLLSVLERIAVLSAHDVQRVGLSATVGNPGDILTWVQGTSKRPGVVVDPPKTKTKRDLRIVRRPTLTELAEEAAAQAKGKKSLFFCQSRAMTEAVAEHMRGHDVDVFVHHSAVSKEERLLAEERFHKASPDGRGACIACTSTLDLGIDVGDLDLVLQAEAPDTVSSFLQRMGRTGRRAGKNPNTTFYCESDDAVLQATAIVELARGGFVEHVDVQTRCWPVLVHQLLALSLAHDGIGIDDAWRQLERVSDFREIHRAEFERLVSWMLRDQSLVLLDGLLLIGPKAERRFGRQNFMELSAVFSSPQSYTVERSEGGPLGTLNQAFVDRLVEGVSCFLLGGRPWVVNVVNHTDRVVKVGPAPRGRQPTWGGFIPQFLGFDLCQAILRVLIADDAPTFLDDEAKAALDKEREHFAGILDAGGGVEFDGDEVRWWTFAGGRINSTLRYALQALKPEWKVTPDNFCVKVRGSIDQPAFREAVERLRDLEFWEDDELWRVVAAAFPNYRLSKFQPLMPPWIEREVMADYLLDVGGAWRFLSGRTDEAGPTLTALRTPPAADAAPAPVVDDEVVRVRPTLPVEWIGSDGDLRALCGRLRGEARLGLDVETTLTTRALCLVQLSWSGAVALIDVLEIASLEPLAELLAEPTIEKVIHNAAFERSVLGRLGITIEPVVDTLALSRAKHGRKIDGGHGLKAVCARELGVVLDKAEQTSNWARRPLSARQQAYAAVDAEVLLKLREALQAAEVHHRLPPPAC
jgi:ATP-dependent Lhr-like helicase